MPSLRPIASSIILLIQSEREKNVFRNKFSFLLFGLVRTNATGRMVSALHGNMKLAPFSCRIRYFKDNSRAKWLVSSNGENGN
jgi:hypothetical protein